MTQAPSNDADNEKTLSKKERRKLARLQKKQQGNVVSVSSEKTNLDNVSVASETVETVASEPTNEQLATVEKTDNVVSEKETMLAVVTTFKLALSDAKGILAHLVPANDVDKVASWLLWINAFKELFVTFLASLVSIERLAGERITIDAENWKTFQRFCFLVSVGYNGSQGSKSMFPRTGETLLPYKVCARLYEFFLACRTKQVQHVVNTVVGAYRMSYDGTLFFLTPVGRTFETLGEYKTALRIPEKVTEPTTNVATSVATSVESG